MLTVRFEFSDLGQAMKAQSTMTQSVVTDDYIRVTPVTFMPKLGRYTFSYIQEDNNNDSDLFLSIPWDKIHAVKFSVRKW